MIYVKKTRFKHTCNDDHNVGRRKQQKPAYHVFTCKFPVSSLMICWHCNDEVANLYLKTWYAGFYRATLCWARYATPIPSVRPSVTRVFCVKTAELIIEILSSSDRPIILVFRHQGSLRKSDSFTPNGGAKYKGVAIFDQYAAISRKR